MIDEPSGERDPAAAGQRLPPSTPTENGHRERMQVAGPASDASDDVGLGDFSVQLDMSTRRITVRGELDLWTVPVLAGVLAQLLDLDFGETTLDFARVSFIDAAGLGCLAGFANKLAEGGATLSISGVSARLRRVFDIVELGGLLQPP